MTFMIKLPRACTIVLSITVIAIGLLPSISVAKPITTTDLLKNLRRGEPWDRGVFTATKTVMFQQDASGGTDATTISKIRLSYFISANCTGAVAGTGSYTTPDGTSYTINTSTAFGLVAASTWNVGSTKLSIANMTTIQSIAVTFKSTNSNTPQANFSGLSYACIPFVTCTAGPSGECTSGSATQHFTLKTTAAIGDPADGGVIACLSDGTSNLIAALSDITATDNQWSTATTPSISTTDTDGATNTAHIITQFGAGVYAAAVCNDYNAAGGYTSGWFLPAINQLSCINTNKSTFSWGGNFHWSSTQSTNTTQAKGLGFTSGSLSNQTKTSSTGFRVHCVRAI